MPMNRPTGRQRNITGQGKAIGRRGSGLGTGPVGSPRPGQSGGHSSHRGTGGTRSGGGGIKLILILLALLLGGGGAGGFLLGGSGDTPTNEGYTQVEQQGSSGNILSMLGNLGGGSVSSGWDNGSNAGKADSQNFADTFILLGAGILTDIIDSSLAEGIDGDIDEAFDITRRCISGHEDITKGIDGRLNDNIGNGEQ